MSTTGARECRFCDEPLEASDPYEGLCTPCGEVSGSAPSYCCGQMYDEGELYCRSCGEPL